MRRLTSIFSILFAVGSLSLLSGCYAENSDDAAADDGTEEAAPASTAPEEGGSDAE